MWFDRKGKLILAETTCKTEEEKIENNIYISKFFEL